MATIVIFGASGFVGATFAERLLARGEHELRLCIHSTGNAWRLSRRGLGLRAVDLQEREQVREALAGATHVVNCTRGTKGLMYDGLDNLLRESLAAGVQRFVHLSSVSAYGEQAPGTSLHEDASPSPELSTYGEMKLEQDRRVMAACRKGLPSVVLAPPNISGEYSPFLLSLIVALRGDSLLLVDEGDLPCSLVDVRNLAQAMELALWCERADARRCFVTDQEDITWRNLVEALVPLAETTLPLRTVTRDEAIRLSTRTAARPSVLATMRTFGSIMTSPQARAVLKQDALVRCVYDFATGRLPGGLGKRIRSRLNRPRSGAEQTETTASLDLGPQIRAVRHVGERARTVLGYRPEFDFERSMEVFRSWYERLHGFGTEDWELLKNL